MQVVSKNPQQLMESAWDATGENQEAMNGAWQQAEREVARQQPQALEDAWKGWSSERCCVVLVSLSYSLRILLPDVEAKAGPQTNLESAWDDVHQDINATTSDQLEQAWRDVIAGDESAQEKLVRETELLVQQTSATSMCPADLMELYRAGGGVGESASGSDGD